MGDFLNIAKHYWDATVKDELYEKQILLSWFMDGGRTDVKGQDMKAVRYNADSQDLAYAYGDDTIVVASEIDDKAVATFQWKAARHDLAIKERQMLLTKNMTEVPLNFVTDRVDRARVSFMRYLDNRLWGLSGTTTDGSLEFQGLLDALTHDLTYGGTTRATTVTNANWQGASLAGTYADQATVYPASIATVRDMYDTITDRYDAEAGEITLFVGRGPFRELQGQVEAQVTYPTPGKKLKYGRPYFSIDDIDVVYVNKLTEANAPGASRWAFMLNRQTWRFQLHPERNFAHTMGGLQDDRIGGVPQAMSTIKIMGNCTCEAPWANIWVPKFGS